jgi:hypothetical protein
MLTQTLLDSSTHGSAGYYSAFDLNVIDLDLAPANVKSGTDIFGVAGTLSASPPSPSAATITFSVLDFNSSAHLSDVNMDCNVNAYDRNNQNSYFALDFNIGSYSCIFSKSGYANKTVSVEVPDFNAKPYVVLMFRLWYTAFIHIEGGPGPFTAYCTGLYDSNSPGWPSDANSDVSGNMTRKLFNGNHTLTLVGDGYFPYVESFTIAGADINKDIMMYPYSPPG